MMQKILSRSENDATRPFGHHEGLFRGPPAAHGYDTPEVRKKEDPKVGIMAKEGGKGRTIAGPPAG